MENDTIADMNDTSVATWLEQLAARQPTPGGGGAAALAAAIAAGLIGMVSNYTTGDKWADRSERMQAIAAEAAELRVQALNLMQADAEAFMAVGTAYGMARSTNDEKAQRTHAIQSALLAAAQPPLEVAQVAMRLVELAQELRPVSNPNVISDVAVAASQARAALEGAIVNIEINAKLITDADLQQALRDQVSVAETSIKQAAAVVAAVRQGLTS